MNKIDYQVLREAAEAIKIVATPQKLLAFRMKVTPQVVLALLDELEAKTNALQNWKRGKFNYRLATTFDMGTQ